MKQQIQLYNQSLFNQTNILVHLLSMCNNPTIKIVTTAWHNRAISLTHNSLLIALEASHTWFGTHTNPQCHHAQIPKVECNYISPNRGITPPPTHSQEISCSQVSNGQDPTDIDTNLVMYTSVGMKTIYNYHLKVCHLPTQVNCL